MGMSELRFHPFLDQWVITATHRQDRTFHPPADYCPLCPTHPGGFPTEIPQDHYDIVVFENKFPSLSPNPPEPAVPGTDLLPVRPSVGTCEVVCYSQVHESTFAGLPYSQVRKLARVWKERYEELGAHPEVEYVFIFENKGKEIGVTLSHPHGQIYAYPFIPPTAKIETDSEIRYFAEHGEPLMAAVLREHGIGIELPEGRNSSVVYENERFVAFIPFFARYPYELYVTSKTHISSLAKMDGPALDDLSDALLTITRKFDGLFNFSLPYIMVMHQEPTKAGHEESSWFHVEFYPPYRTANKLKYLAGSEAGAGAFINDTLAEEKSQTLREIQIPKVR